MKRGSTTVRTHAALGVDAARRFAMEDRALDRRRVSAEIPSRDRRRVRGGRDRHRQGRRAHAVRHARGRGRAPRVGLRRPIRSDPSSRRRATPCRTCRDRADRRGSLARVALDRRGQSFAPRGGDASRARRRRHRGARPARERDPGHARRRARDVDRSASCRCARDRMRLAAERRRRRNGGHPRAGGVARRRRRERTYLRRRRAPDGRCATLPVQRQGPDGGRGRRRSRGWPRSHGARTVGIDDAAASLPRPIVHVPRVRQPAVHACAPHPLVVTRRTDRPRQPRAGLHVPSSAGARARMEPRASHQRRGPMVPAGRRSVPRRPHAPPRDRAAA
jgi:hypothetical protein